MIREAIEKIQELVRAGQGVKQYHDSGDKVHYVDSATGEKWPVDKAPVWPRAQVASVDSLIAYLNGPLCAGVEDQAVFVDDKTVLGAAGYNRHTSHNVVLLLKPSPEFAALETLMRGVAQKELWRLLISDLHKAMPDELLLQVGQLKVSASSDKEVTINPTGLGSESNSGALSIQCASPKGMDTKVINLDWTWKGRRWSAFDTEYEVKLRLEVSVEDGLRFTFHALLLDDMLQKARLDLVALLHKEVDGGRFTVYDGSCSLA